MPQRPEAIDISLPLTATTPPVPGDPSFSRRLFLTHNDVGCEASSLVLSAHSGTHLDFPAHFFPEGKRAGDYPAAAFIRPAVVIDAGEQLRLRPGILSGIDLQPGVAVLFRTINSTAGRFTGTAFPEDFATLTPGLAQELAHRGVGLVGLDALSVEPLSNPAYPVHHILLGAGILILEGIVLDAVPAGHSTLLCLPLSMPEAEASPVRAVLLPATSPNNIASLP